MKTRTYDDGSDVLFLQKRFMALDGRKNDDVLRGAGLALINLVESDIPLSRHSRNLIAGDLRRLYFPKSKRAERFETLSIQALARRQLVDFLTEKYKAAGIRNPKTKAEGEVAILFGLSVEAMRKRQQRHKGR